MRRIVTLSLLVIGSASIARADWQVRHAADDPRVAQVLLSALIAAPDDRSALHRLLSHVHGAAIGKTAVQCDARATGTARIACAHLYREAGRVDEAIARYREVIAAAPDDPRPQRALGDLLAKKGRNDEALLAFEAARAHVGAADRAALLDAMLPLYALARTPAAPARQHAAEATATELLALRPTDPTLKKRAAEALAAVGATESAERLFTTLAAQTHDPLTRVPLLFRSAELQIDAHHEDAAAITLQSALDLLPARDGRRREALDQLVSIARKKDELAALASKWSALPDRRRDAAMEELLGQILDELGDDATARRHLQRAIALDPGALGPRRTLIRSFVRTGDEDAAIAEQRRLVAAAHGDPRYALELAERLFARPQGRKEALALAAELGRRHGDATTHAALGALYQKWGEKDLALAEQGRLVRLEPDDPEHLIALGELYDQRGDKTQANKTWRRIAPGDNPPLAALLRLADVLGEHDQPGEALALLERAAHDHPLDDAVTRRLADVLDHLHRDQEAESIYRKLLDAAIAADDAIFVRDGGARWLELAARRGILTSSLRSLSAIAEKPTSAARVELALLVARGRMRERRNLEAERLLALVAAKAPRPVDRARALENLAELISPHGGPRAGEALTLMVRAASEDPARASMLFGKASRRAAELYRDADALMYAERAVAAAPTDAEAQERLGTLLETSDPGRALTAYDRALDLDPGRDRLRLRAAELSLRSGDDSAAASRYRVLLLRAHDAQALEEASRRAVVVHELTGQLGELEREISPRAAASGRGSAGEAQSAMRHLLLEIESRYVPLLATRRDAGDEHARTELQRVATHALSPLLDAVLDGDQDERQSALALLGQLASPRAAPLLLRLAAGEAARRGAEPPSADLRIAAAQASVWLTPASELARVERLAGDPEQRIRLAAAMTLARFSDRPGVSTRIDALIGDDNDRIAATACLAADPRSMDKGLVDQLTAIALDDQRPLSRRACAVALARRAEIDTPLARATTTRIRAHTEVAFAAGVVRVLFASGEAEAIEEGLVLALGSATLRRALAGARAPASTKDDAGVADPALWLSTHLAAAEAATGNLPNDGIVDAARSLLSSGSSAVLDDLTLDDALLPRLVAASDGDRNSSEARARILDRLTLALIEWHKTHADSLALRLLAERPGGSSSVVAAATNARTRLIALTALASPAAAILPTTLSDQLLPALRAALSANDWRERRAALLCITRQAATIARLETEVAALARDPNPLVSELVPRQ